MGYIYNDEDNAPMDEKLLPTGKNCHERCPYSKICYEHYHCKGDNDPSYPFECAIYDKILDHVMEAENIPFYDPDFDLPEEEENGTDS